MSQSSTEDEAFEKLSIYFPGYSLTVDSYHDSNSYWGFVAEKTGSVSFDADTYFDWVCAELTDYDYTVLGVPVFNFGPFFGRFILGGKKADGSSVSKQVGTGVMEPCFYYSLGGPITGWKMYKGEGMMNGMVVFYDGMSKSQYFTPTTVGVTTRDLWYVYGPSTFSLSGGVIYSGYSGSSTLTKTSNPSTSSDLVNSVSDSSISFNVNQADLVGSHSVDVIATNGIYSTTTTVTVKIRPVCDLSNLALALPADMSTPLYGNVYQDLTGMATRSFQSQDQYSAWNSCKMAYRVLNAATAANYINCAGCEVAVENAGATVVDTILHLYAYDTAWIGTHSVTIEAYFIEYEESSVPSTKQKTFQVTIEPLCVITQFQTLPVQTETQILPEYLINTGPSASHAFELAFEPASCNYKKEYTVYVDGVQSFPAWLRISPDPNQMSSHTTASLWLESSDVGAAGVYSVAIESKLNHTPVITSTDRFEFVATLYADTCSTLEYSCPVTTLSSPQIYNQHLTDANTLPQCDSNTVMLFSIGPSAPAASFTFNACTDSVGGCGSHQYIIVVGHAGLSQAQDVFYNVASSKQYTFQTSDPTQIGDHEIKYYVQTINYPQFNGVLATEFSFCVRVVADCWDTAISYAPPSKLVHPVGTSAINGQGDLLYTIPILDDSISNGSAFCGAMTYVHLDITSADFATPDAIATFDGVDTYTVYGSDNSQWGNYVVHFGVTLDDYPNMPRQDFSFEVEIVPDCNSEIVQELHTVFFDSIVRGLSAQVDFTGYYTFDLEGEYSAYCGPLEFVLDPSPVVQSYLTYDGSFLLDLAPQNTGTQLTGTFTHILRARLADWPNRYFDTSFDISIRSCPITQYEPVTVNQAPLPANLKVQHQFIAGLDDPVAFDFVFDMTISGTGCSQDEFQLTYQLEQPLGIDLTHSLPPIVSVFDGLTPSLTISTTDAAQEGIHTFYVKSSVILNPQDRVSDSWITFEIEVLVDPCLKDNSLSVPVLTDMLFVIDHGAVPTVQIFEPVVDAVGLCGPIKYTVTSSWTDWSSVLTFNAPSFSLYSQKGTDVGVYSIVISAELKDYPNLTAVLGITLSFQIEIDSVCLQTQLLEAESLFYDMHLLTGSGEYSTTQEIAIQDKVSTWSNGDGFQLCGPRKFTIYDASDYIGYSQFASLLFSHPNSKQNANIVHSIEQEAYIGNFQLTSWGFVRQNQQKVVHLEVSLAEYPLVEAVDIYFETFIFARCREQRIANALDMYFHYVQSSFEPTTEFYFTHQVGLPVATKTVKTRTVQQDWMAYGFKLASPVPALLCGSIEIDYAWTKKTNAQGELEAVELEDQHKLPQFMRAIFIQDGKVEMVLYSDSDAEAGTYEFWLRLYLPDHEPIPASTELRPELTIQVVLYGQTDETYVGDEQLEIEEHLLIAYEVVGEDALTELVAGVNCAGNSQSEECSEEEEEDIAEEEEQGDRQERDSDFEFEEQSEESEASSDISISVAEVKAREPRYFDDFKAKYSKVLQEGMDLKLNSQQYLSLMAQLQSWPHAYPLVTNIGNDGVVHIHFSKPILLAGSEDKIANQIKALTLNNFMTISIDETEYSDQVTGTPVNKQDKRRLQEASNGGQEGEFNKQFKWHVLSLDPTSLVVKLNFERDEDISAIGLDKVRFQLNDLNLLSNTTGQSPDPDFIKEITPLFQRVSIQRQVITSIEELALQASQPQAIGLQVAASASVVVQAFSSSGLQYISGSINALVLIVHMPMNMLDYPQSYNTVCKELIRVVTFDILETLAEFDDAFQLDYEISPTQEFNDGFAMIGYGSSDPFDLLGTVNIFFLVILLQSVWFLVRLIMPEDCQKRLKLKDRQTCASFSNNWVFFALQAFFEFCITACAVFYPRSETTLASTPQKTNVDKFALIYTGLLIFVASGLLVVLLIVPLCYSGRRVEAAQQLRKQKHRRAVEQFYRDKAIKAIEQWASGEVPQVQGSGLTSPDYASIYVKQVSKFVENSKTGKLEETFKAEDERLSYFQTLSEGLEPHSRSAQLFNSVFILRRLVLVLVAFSLQKYPLFQITCMLGLCVVNQAYLRQEAVFVDRDMYRVEVFNDLIVYLGAVHSMALVTTRGFVQQQSMIGLSLLGCVVFGIIFNIIKLVQAVINKVRRWSRKKYIAYRTNSYLWDRQHARVKTCHCACSKCGAFRNRGLAALSKLGPVQELEINLTPVELLTDGYSLYESSFDNFQLSSCRSDQKLLSQKGNQIGSIVEESSPSLVDQSHQSHQRRRQPLLICSSDTGPPKNPLAAMSMTQGQSQNTLAVEQSIEGVELLGLDNSQALEEQPHDESEKADSHEDEQIGGSKLRRYREWCTSFASDFDQSGQRSVEGKSRKLAQALMEDCTRLRFISMAERDASRVLMQQELAKRCEIVFCEEDYDSEQDWEIVDMRRNFPSINDLIVDIKQITKPKPTPSSLESRKKSVQQADNELEMQLFGDWVDQVVGREETQPANEEAQMGYRSLSAPTSELSESKQVKSSYSKREHALQTIVEAADSSFEQLDTPKSAQSQS